LPKTLIRLQKLLRDLRTLPWKLVRLSTVKTTLEATRALNNLRKKKRKRKIRKKRKRVTTKRRRETRSDFLWLARLEN
jgi:hypothetical protein